MSSFIVGSLLVLGVLALLLGIVLAVASKVFHVETDPRIEQVDELLPGANCGACGLAGCAAAAEKIVAGDAAPTVCPVCNEDARARIYELLGMSAEASEPQIARVVCGGGTGCADKEEYHGVDDCRAAVLVHGGPKACEYACVGLGSCVDACPFEAIFMGDDGLPHVIEERCTACGACERVCPRDVIKVMPAKRTVWVKCSSHDKGKVVNKICETGCIACRKCEKECPFDAIHVIDNLAVIDYETCKLCGKCAKVCPKDTIVDLRARRRAEKKTKRAEAAAETA
ncbi:MAG: RnfABCDGE type electron transport complex subunit B [Planctomycetota bacterium]